MVFYILVVYFCTTLISQVFLLLQIFNTVTLRMPFTRNHYHGTGSAKHSSYSYMTRALRALVCNWMSSCFAKPSSVIMISCKRYTPCRETAVCFFIFLFECLHFKSLLASAFHLSLLETCFNIYDRTIENTQSNKNE